MNQNQYAIRASLEKTAADNRATIAELKARIKENRILSAANESDLRDAQTAHNTGVNLTNGVLAQVTGNPAPTDGDDSRTMGFTSVDTEDVDAAAAEGIANVVAHAQGRMSPMSAEERRDHARHNL